MQEYAHLAEDLHHRCTREFLSAESQLKPHMLHAAATGEVHVLLEAELKALENIPLSEQYAEGLHRDVSGEHGRARGSKLPWLSATARLDDNLAFYDVHRSAEYDQLWQAEWRLYKRVARASPAHPWRPTKMKSLNVQRFVYAMDRPGLLEQWPSNNNLVTGAVGDTVFFRAEYLSMVLLPGFFYSVPTELATVPVEASMADGIANALVLRVFQVVDIIQKSTRFVCNPALEKHALPLVQPFEA